MNVVCGKDGNYGSCQRTEFVSNNQLNVHLFGEMAFSQGALVGSTQYGLDTRIQCNHNTSCMGGTSILYDGHCFSNTRN